MQRQADLYAIDQIEKRLPQGDVEEGHRPDDEPVGPERDVHVRPREDADGKQQIRKFWLKSECFQPENTLGLRPSRYKLRITVNGDRGTLYFECHFVDAKTGKLAAVTAADGDVARIDGSWLITNFVGSTAELKL